MTFKALQASYSHVQTKLVTAGGTTFAYRELGPHGGTPLVLLNHWGAVLDNFDPRIVDGLASQHHVVALDYRGIGLSGGTAPVTVDEMARDTIAVIRAMGFDQVKLLGFSLGGFVAQDVALKAPTLVRKLILTGTGPRGGQGIDRVGAVSWPLKQVPQNLAGLRMPVLIANGDSDVMAPTTLSRDMARRIPQAQLVIYEDAGHGGIFQYHADFVSTALAFLATPRLELEQHESTHI